MTLELTRRNVLQTTAAALAASALTSSRSEAAKQPKAARPNILWICTDQQRYDTITSLGNPHIRTPNIDKLVARGVAFTHAYCQSPICTPSRASFLTGMHPDALHACINGNESWDNAAPLITKTLADAGYDCGLSGKLHLSSAHGRIEKRPDDGYRVFHWSHHPKDDWPKGHAYCDWLKARGEDFKKLHRKNGFIPAELHQTTWCAKTAEDFIREKRKGPWLFSLNCFDPHSPLDPPKKYLDRYDIKSLPGPLFRDSDLAAQKKLKGVNFQGGAAKYKKLDAQTYQAKYWAQIELIDENVGRLMKVLDETGQRENTIVIFTSDHGETLGDHGLRRKGCRFYECLVRVPLIISWPGRFKQALKSDALVELTDIAPTLLQAAGLPIPKDMHGKSLLPILEGQCDSREHRPFVRSIYYRVLAGAPSYASMIRTREYKLVQYHGHGLGELFDMKTDPHEFDNLWDDPKLSGVRFDLLTKAFDAAALATDLGPRRVGRY
ncbi:MAG: sulfatase-like hydrolase/transferase [Phycisphaerae bacterium]|nr:sulfatase-like hydrolase/transferase [Phycisphaerae bacterium]